MHPYNMLKDVVLSAGASLLEEEWYPDVFGSAWSIFQTRSEKLRLVWDGKDGWGFIQKQGTSGGEWHDIEPRITEGDLEGQPQNTRAIQQFRAAVCRFTNAA